MRGEPTWVTTPPADGGFDELFAREHLPMVRLATLLLGSSHLAEEVVQDSFAAVDARWGEIDRPGAYLRTVVVNGCRGVLRRRDLERRVEDLHVADEAHHLPTHLLELRDALDRLSERQRAVIVLRYFVDVADNEIASTLGCRVPTVRSLARRALHTLREELR
jgi:RNA polymerase sigma factor (sigma-70 family)